MRIYECENCHSVFILNESDPRVISGDYCFLPNENSAYCPLCNAGMVLVSKRNQEEEG